METIVVIIHTHVAISLQHISEPRPQSELIAINEGSTGNTHHVTMGLKSN